MHCRWRRMHCRWRWGRSRRRHPYRSSSLGRRHRRAKTGAAKLKRPVICLGGLNGLRFNRHPFKGTARRLQPGHYRFAGRRIGPVAHRKFAQAFEFVHHPQQQPGHGRIKGAPAIADLSQQMLGVMRNPLHPAQSQRRRHALNRVHSQEQRGDQGGVYAFGRRGRLDRDEQRLQPLEVLGGLNGKFLPQALVNIDRHISEPPFRITGDDSEAKRVCQEKPATEQEKLPLLHSAQLLHAKGEQTNTRTKRLAALALAASGWTPPEAWIRSKNKKLEPGVVPLDRIIL